MPFTLKTFRVALIRQFHEAHGAISEAPVRDIAIFATGGKGPNEGGSGMETILRTSKIIRDRVGIIVTHYEKGGVEKKHGEIYNVDSPEAPPLEVWDDLPKRGPEKKFTPEEKTSMALRYQDLKRRFRIKMAFMSGCMKQIFGLEPNELVNIHPGPTQGEYGGEDMYGDNVHKKVWGNYFDGRIISSAVTMHYAPSGMDDDMDSGPIIAQIPVSLVGCESWEDVKKRVNAMEHKIQWQLTEHVINGKITWSGKKGDPVQFSEGLTINVNGRLIILDGKAADISPDSSYGKVVVKNGDAFSDGSKDECDKAMEGTPAYKEGLVMKTDTGSWETAVPPSTVTTYVKKDIDGVGTKVQIYLIMFEALCQLYKNGEMSVEDCVKGSTDLWVRMLHDLIAMNTDDLRDGQVAVMVSNILDINHLNAERGRIFALSMIRAMGIATREIGIGNGVGETAVIGDSRTVVQLKDVIEELHKLIQGIPKLTKVQRKYIDIGIKDHKIRMRSIDGQIDFNIGGTVQGVRKYDKLVPLGEGHAIVALYERPDENGIIGPRSNGLTAIRYNMSQLAGKNWPNMTFEKFLEHIGEEQSRKLPDALKQECKGLLLGQIATGKTTVYNQFISRDLLGGFEGEPSVKLSSIIHVTGNPLKKIQGGLRKRKDLGISMDISTSKIPQIIQIIQHLTGMSDAEAAGSFNMGVPQAIICPVSEVDSIIAKASARGLTAERKGTVEKLTEGKPRSVIKGVGVGKSEISMM